MLIKDYNVDGGVKKSVFQGRSLVVLLISSELKSIFTSDEVFN